MSLKPGGFEPPDLQRRSDDAFAFEEHVAALRRVNRQFIWLDRRNRFLSVAYNERHAYRGCLGEQQYPSDGSCEASNKLLH